MHLTYPAQNLTTKTTGTRKRAFQRSKTVTNTIPLDIVCAKIATNLMMSTNIISTTCHTFTQIAHVTNAIKNVCAEIATPRRCRRTRFQRHPYRPIPRMTSDDYIDGNPGQTGTLPGKNDEDRSLAKIPRRLRSVRQLWTVILRRRGLRQRETGEDKKLVGEK